jgi:hypothetical protein
LVKVWDGPLKPVCDDLKELEQELSINREAILQTTILLQRIGNDIERIDDQLRELGRLVEYTLDG